MIARLLSLILLEIDRVLGTIYFIIFKDCIVALCVIRQLDGGDEHV